MLINAFLIILKKKEPLVLKNKWKEKNPLDSKLLKELKLMAVYNE